MSRGHIGEQGSNRSFGVVFALLFLGIGTWPLWRGAPPHGWAILASLVLAAVAIWRSAWLVVPNRYWSRFGILLGSLIGPVALALLYFGVLTPMGWMVRRLGKDPLRLKFDPQADSYWIVRDPPGPPPDSMKRQF